MSKSGKRKIIIGITTGLILLIAGILMAIPLLVMNPMVNKHVDFNKLYTAAEYNLEAQHLFVTTEDGLKISAFEVSAENPKAVIICLSGIHNPSATIYFGHARLFKEYGYATVLFDMRAHGESEGDLITLGYREILDTKAVVKYIKDNPAYNNVPVIVFGLSMGGVTAINSTGEIPEIDGLISLSAFSAWEDIFFEMMSGQAPLFLAKMVKPFVPLVTSVKFRANVWAHRPISAIEKLGNRPALLMHTSGDSQVPFSNFERIVNHAPAHVETFVREGDIHLITESFENPAQDSVYASTIINFLTRNFK